MDGRSASVHPAEVIFDGKYLIASHRDDGRELIRWALAEVRVENIQERDVVHLESSANPDAQLTLRGRSTADELAELGLGTHGLPRDGSRRLVLATLLVLAIAGVVSLIWMGVDPVSRAVAHNIPMDVERSLSGPIAERLEPAYCEDDAAVSALTGLSARLLGEDREFSDVHILNFDIPNAFALPGGTIVLTRALTDAAEGPDEIAGVLAHELAHVEQRHVMIGIVRGALLSTLWAVSVGDFTGMMVIDPSTLFEIATLEFSREDEAEADRVALEMLARAQIRSDGLADFFQRLEAAGGEPPEWLSSHPASGRRALAANTASRENETLRPAFSQEEWQAIKRACDDASIPEFKLQDLLF